MFFYFADTHPLRRESVYLNTDSSMLMMRNPLCKDSMNFAAASCLYSLAEGEFCIDLIGLILLYVTPSYFLKYFPSHGRLIRRWQTLITSA
jgi:hypothetical protein